MQRSKKKYICYYALCILFFFIYKETSYAQNKEQSIQFSIGFYQSGLAYEKFIHKNISNQLFLGLREHISLAENSSENIPIRFALSPYISYSLHLHTNLFPKKDIRYTSSNYIALTIFQNFNSFYTTNRSYSPSIFTAAKASWEMRRMLLKHLSILFGLGIGAAYDWEKQEKVLLLPELNISLTFLF